MISFQLILNKYGNTKILQIENEYLITNLNNEIIHYKVWLQKNKRKYLNYILISSLDLEFPAKTEFKPKTNEVRG